MKRFEDVRIPAFLLLQFKYFKEQNELINIRFGFKRSAKPRFTPDNYNALHVSNLVFITIDEMIALNTNLRLAV